LRVVKSWSEVIFERVLSEDQYSKCLLRFSTDVLGGNSEL